MPETAYTLRRAAHIISYRGLHTGEQFASADSSALDIAAAIYFAAENTFPAEFFTDENTSLEIIAASADAMAAIRILSAVIGTEPCATEIAPGHDVPDYIEHVCHWAMTTPVFGTQPPTTSEVIGALLRAATAADSITAFPHQTERSAA
ncbi:hypothetical protein OG402_41420 [Streptomyces anulatus]|uniref:DUF6197 family protein n=1 Tax=Streptomyces anulatus TaxID=1892 RepID=UPI00225BAF64|nr:hypothetical protein [Streptomyces anulatus]MCX4606891.1 hypothetical protein [Streptomyces anulatus]